MNFWENRYSLIFEEPQTAKNRAAVIFMKQGQKPRLLNKIFLKFFPHRHKAVAFQSQMKGGIKMKPRF